jgi:hypothetical protein
MVPASKNVSEETGVGTGGGHLLVRHSPYPVH